MTPERGFGGVPDSAGTGFRVWAPFADGVAVRFLDGDADGRLVPLAAETGGCWSGRADGAGAGRAYRYEITSAGVVLPRIDPYAQHVDNSAGHAIVYDPDAFVWPDAPHATPSWDDLVVYELHVGTFVGGVDGPEPALSRMAQRLPYLADLGVSAVELMPVAEFAWDRSWGYNPALPFAVESSYGGPDALKGFVAAAHAAGIAVILDVVLNHFGPGDLEHSLWRFDGWSAGGGGGIYFYEDGRASTPWGSRPDYGRAEVRRFLRDNVRSWLRDYRLDGLRFDATAWIRGIDGSGDPAVDIPDGWSLLQEINDDVAAAQPWKIRIAEDMRGDTWITRPTAVGGAGFPTQWDPDFVQQVRGVVVPADDAARSMAALASAVGRRYGDDPLARVVFTESHDADANGHTRVPAEIDPADPASWWATKRSTLAAAVVLTAPGIPMLFQGQEFLEAHWFDDGVALDWAEAGVHGGIVRLYRDLVRLRRDADRVSRGLRGRGLDVFHINDTDKVIAYHRWQDGGPGDDTIVVLNCADRGYDAYEMGLPRPGTWRVRFNSDARVYDPSFGDHASFDTATTGTPRDGMPYSAAIGLGPYTAVVLSQDVETRDS